MASLLAGVCRICGCTEFNACTISGPCEACDRGLGEEGHGDLHTCVASTCSWLDRRRTLCSAHTPGEVAVECLRDEDLAHDLEQLGVLEQLQAVAERRRHA